MQNINFDKIFRDEVQSFGERKPRLLLHACCAPCSTQCLARTLRHFDVTLHFVNDNITDVAEWEKRLGELKKLVNVVNDGNFEATPFSPLKLVVKPHAPERFFAATRGKEDQKEGGERCGICFALRLAETAKLAAEQNFDYFATTLTVSPYKNARVINEIGAKLAQTHGSKWLATDFKKQNGYAESVRLSQKYGLYRQHYCGCAYSLKQAQDQTK